MCRWIPTPHFEKIDGTLQTDKPVKLLNKLTTKSPIEVEDGLAFKGSDPYFHILVSGVHYNENPLPPAFDNCLVFDTHQINNVNNMEVAFWDAENARPSLVLNQGAPGRASLFERSLIVGAQKGTKSLDGDYTLCNDFPNLACNTSLYGADLGVEHDLEVMGIVYANQIKESTLGAGVSFDELKADNVKVDNITIDNVITDLIRVDSVEINDNVRIKDFAGGGIRTVKVDNNGDLYAE